MTGILKDSFYLQGWRVSPAEGVITRDQEVVHLEPKAMEVLVYLATRPGEVVTREELERDVWRGALVGYDAITNTVIKLRKALGDDARNPRFITTIPKRGYQLIVTPEPGESQSTEDAPTNAGATTTLVAAPVEAGGNRTGKMIGGVVLAIVLVAGLTWQLFSSRDAIDGTPSIAVLPFENLNKDPKQDYLADGVTEDLITDLSKLSNIRVISSNTSSAFRNNQASISKIGDELGVTYVVKGNIRRLKDSFRINVQLVNTDTGFNAWATRYDRDIKELFNIQEDVSRNIVRALAVQVSTEEQSRLTRRSTNSLRAYDYFQEGMRYYRTTSKENSIHARELYRKAIELDPGYGRAYGAIAVTLAMDFRWGWTDSPVADLDKALTLARKAVELDPASPQTYWALGFVRLAQREYAEAKKAALQSVQVAPNYADGYGLLGLISGNLGEAKQAIEYTEQGMRLNPYYTWEYLFVLGQAYYMLKDYTKAAEVLEEANRRNGKIMQTKTVLAAAYVNLGRIEDARWTIEQLRLDNPAITISHIRNTWALANPASVDILAADLRRAGLPE